MTPSAHFSPARLAAVAGAEFRKAWASRIPLAILLTLPAGTYLFAFELYHVERLAEHLPSANAFDALPILFLSTWKTLLFQAVAMTFGAFWMTVDSQYGMIRVGCCQPITRVEYWLGKWLGITAHVVIFTFALAALEILWSVLYSGAAGASRSDVAAGVRFAVDMEVFVVAVTSIAMATASLRRTVGAGIVTATLSVIGLALMTMLPFEVMPPRFVLMRYFAFALGDLRDPFPGSGDSAFRHVQTAAAFYRVAVVTVLIFVMPAVFYFAKRDVVE